MMTPKNSQSHRRSSADKKLEEESEERLSTITDVTELDSGVNLFYSASNINEDL